jgi:hypothetical protein
MYLKRYSTAGISILTKLTLAAKIRIPEDKMGTSDPRAGNAATYPLPSPTRHDVLELISSFQYAFPMACNFKD